MVLQHREGKSLQRRDGIDRTCLSWGQPIADRHVSLLHGTMHALCFARDIATRGKCIAKKYDCAWMET